MQKAGTFCGGYTKGKHNRKGRSSFGSMSVLIPVGNEHEVVDAWNMVSLGIEADQLVAELLKIAKKEGFTTDRIGNKFDQNGNNIRAQEIGERLSQIGGIDLMKKAWWRIEVEKHRTGLRESRSLDLCWNGIGGWRG